MAAVVEHPVLFGGYFGTVYYRVDFKTTHPDNALDIVAHYYVCQVGGLYITVYVDYWEGEVEAKDAVMALFNDLTITKGANRDI